MRKRTLTASAVIFAACCGPAQAHEKWFTGNAGFPLRWDLFFTAKPLLFVGAAIVLTLLAGWLQHKRGREFLPGTEFFGATTESKQRIFAILPAIVGVQVAIPLLVAAMSSKLFTPNAQLPGASAYLAGLLEIFVALAFLYGGLTRLAAYALALLWAVGFAFVGAQAMLDDILYLGIAVFFYMCGRGPLSIDRHLFPAFEPSAALVRHAMDPLRIGAGLSFVIVAFTEKFANIPYGLAFLHQYPVNFSSALHLPLSNETFLLCAGAVELLLGLWLIFGIFQREIILLSWIPLNISLTYFGATEFAGHLPIYGIMALLLIWDRQPGSLAAWVRAITGKGRG